MKQYKFKINGNQYDVTINSISGETADVTVNGTSYQVEMENCGSQPAASPTAPTAPAAPSPAPAAAPVPAAPAPSAGGKKITSPLPGVIVEVNVKVGDTVKAGQQVAVLEAMKMENSIESEFAGTVTAVHVDKGNSVLEGAAIITIG